MYLQESRLEEEERTLLAQERLQEKNLLAELARLRGEMEAQRAVLEAKLFEEQQVSHNRCTEMPRKQTERERRYRFVMLIVIVRALMWSR